MPGKDTSPSHVTFINIALYTTQTVLKQLHSNQQENSINVATEP